MKNLLFVVFMVALIVDGESKLKAAEFFILPNTKTLLMMGETKSSDVPELISYIEDSDVDSIMLKGPGGNLEAGYRISNFLIERNITMILPKNTDCASVCSLIFSSGKKRIMEEGSRLGFHLPFLRLNKDNVVEYCKKAIYESNEDSINTEISDVVLTIGIPKEYIVICLTATFQDGLKSIRKLNRIFGRSGISEKVIDILVSTKPNEMTWIDVTRAQELGLIAD